MTEKRATFLLLVPNKEIDFPKDHNWHLLKINEWPGKYDIKAYFNPQLDALVFENSSATDTHPQKQFLVQVTPSLGIEQKAIFFTMFLQDTAKELFDAGGVKEGALFISVLLACECCLKIESVLLPTPLKKISDIPKNEDQRQKDISFKTIIGIRKAV